MPKKGGGGSTQETNMEIFLDTTTSARRGHSLRAVMGFPNRPLKTADSIDLNPATINTDFYQLDNFMWYDNWTELVTDGLWYYTTSMFYKVMPAPSPTVSSYNYMSIYAKSSEPSNLKIYFASMDNQTTSGFTIGPLTGKWRRYDVPMETSTTWGNRLKEIDFEVYGSASESIWIDEPILLDLRTETEKTEWINLNVIAQNTRYSTNLINAPIAGNYGDLVYPTQANNRTGVISFRTHAPQDDADLAFLEGIKNESGRCYLRSVGEGWPIYLETVEMDVRDSYFGSLRDIRITYVEEEITDDT